MSRPRKNDCHLPPCVYQRHGAYWFVKCGRWRRLGATLATALEEYAHLYEQPRGGMHDLIWRVYNHVKPRLAASTASQYKIAAKRLANIFAEFSPEQVRPRDVAQVKLSMSDTPNMSNRCISFLRAVFNHAVEWQMVDSNPCVGISRMGEAKRKRCPTDEELAAVHAKAGPRLQVIIELHCLTGQRVNDVLRIRRADLTQDGIRFKQQKTAAQFVVRWNAGLRETVERAKAIGGNVQALTLLHNRRGKAPDYRTVHLQWRGACAAAGVLDLQLRDLRARAITSAKRQGLDPRALAGHASETMTQRYIRQHDEPLVDGPSFGQVFDNTLKSRTESNG